MEIRISSKYLTELRLKERPKPVEDPPKSEIALQIERVTEVLKEKNLYDEFCKESKLAKQKDIEEKNYNVINTLKVYVKYCKIVGEEPKESIVRSIEMHDK